MTTKPPVAWDTRIMRVPRVRTKTIQKSTFFGLIRWEEAVQEHYTAEEAWLAVSIKFGQNSAPELCWATCTDSHGFNIVIENKQVPGEITSKKWERVSQFRIFGYGDEAKLKKVLGRHKVDGVELDGAKAIAYIFSLPDWEKATINTLIQNAKKDDEVY